MKRKKFWIVLAVCLGIIVLLSVKVYLFFNAKPNIKINYVAKWNKLSKPANYDPNQNAYFDYKKALDCEVKRPQQINYPDKYPDWSDWPGDMNEGQLKIVKDWVKQNSKSIYYFKQASVKPYSWSENDENNVDTDYLAFGNFALVNFMDCVTAVEWEAKINASDNQLPAAFDNIAILLQTGNLLIYGKKSASEQLDGQFARIRACRAMLMILDNGRIDKPLLEDLKKKLDIINSNAQGTIDLETERMTMYHNIQRYFSDDGKGSGHLLYAKIKGSFSRDEDKFSLSEYLDNLFSGKRQPRRPGPLWLAIRGPDRKAYLQMADKLIQCQYDLQGKLSQKERKAKEDVISSFYNLVRQDYPFLTFRIPRTDDLALERRTKAELQGILTLLSIFLYKADKGSYPVNLTELVLTGYIKTIPEDPFRNGPLIYKQAVDNFTLYSVGMNGTDEGGKIIRDNAGRILMWDKKGDTVFWPRPKETEQEKQKRLAERK